MTYHLSFSPPRSLSEALLLCKWQYSFFFSRSLFLRHFFVQLISPLSVRKHCPLFTHKSNTFTSFHPFKWMGMQRRRNPPNSPYHLKHVDPPFNISMQWPTPLTTPNNSSITAHKLPHIYATKFPFVTMGCPNSPPKLPLLFDDHHQNLIHPFIDRPLSPPKWHVHPISRFATADVAYRQTDRHRDGPGECSVP